VAAVAPSGQRLARLMTSEITPQHGPVLELGPGTGVFTRALVARGVRQPDLTLVELDRRFAALLRERFPEARVVEGSAAALDASGLFPERRAGAAISGLGLLSMPVEIVQAILAGAFACLRPGGAFYQFTYGPACPVPRAVMADLGLRAERIGGTWVNLPPAAVYRIVRDAAPSPGPV
jgi:phospholipid N-methyltransferase